MKIVINKCFGGFGLSEAAYEKLIEYGIPVRAYKEQVQDPDTRRYLPEPDNEGEVIFDDALSEVKRMTVFNQRYWDTWARETRTHPLLIRVVEELGGAASGQFASLEVIEIPDDVDWELNEYDGVEHVAEKHRTWS